MQHTPGGSVVGARLRHSAISTLNLAEVLDYSRMNGIDTDGMVGDLKSLGLRIEPLTPEDANAIAELADPSKQCTLSLSDRACLVLAQRLGVPALTADPAWSHLELDIDVQVLR